MKKEDIEKLLIEAWEKIKRVVRHLWEIVKPLVDNLRKVVDKPPINTGDEVVEKSFLDDDYQAVSDVEIGEITDAVVREMSLNWKTIKRGDFRTKKFRDAVHNVVKGAIEKEVKK